MTMKTIQRDERKRAQVSFCKSYFFTNLQIDDNLICSDTLHGSVPGRTK